MLLKLLPLVYRTSCSIKWPLLVLSCLIVVESNDLTWSRTVLSHTSRWIKSPHLVLDCLVSHIVAKSHGLVLSYIAYLVKSNDLTWSCPVLSRISLLNRMISPSLSHIVLNKMTTPGLVQYCLVYRVESYHCRIKWPHLITDSLVSHIELNQMTSPGLGLSCLS